jgi:hypothetical protein
MVVEYIRYTVPAAMADRFVDAYRTTGHVLDEEMKHYAVRLDRAPGHVRSGS